MNSVTQISKLEIINNQIASQEIEAGRKKGSVNLIAVSKTKSMDQIKPVLDGGHLLFLLYEAIRGKPLPNKYMLAVSNIFAVCLYL